MAEVHSKALKQNIDVDRLIGKISGDQPGPTLVFIGGLHGNEPSGVFALHRVLQELQRSDISFSGNFYALAGNLWALERGQRFDKEDLNRAWTSERLAQLQAGTLQPSNEDIAQQIDIYQTIRHIMEIETGPFYFFDLHSTSSDTIPFLTVNDSLLNRKFTEQYPLPLILGIEEYLEGTLLSYLNEWGYVAFGHEGGQHDRLDAIENHIAFIYLTLVFTGFLERSSIDFEKQYNLLDQEANGHERFYEIYYRYEVKNDEDFIMLPGFRNFQTVEKGTELAHKNGHTVTAEQGGLIFLPLYQSQGNDGFFQIRAIPPLFLRLSSVMRKMHIDRILPLLPGIRWTSPQREALAVDLRVARFFATQFFHLLGYRNKRIDRNSLIIKNREVHSRDEDYQHADWINN